MIHELCMECVQVKTVGTHNSHIGLLMTQEKKRLMNISIVLNDDYDGVRWEYDIFCLSHTNFSLSLSFSHETMIMTPAH